MTGHGSWVTPVQAAQLVARPLRTIYRWVHDDRVRSRIKVSGKIEIDALHLLEVEPTIRPGRPRGSAIPKEGTRRDT